MKQKKFFPIEDKKFHQLVDDLFVKIEDNLNIYNNDIDIDIDYEIQNYVLKIEFLNKSVIIINRQESLQQIWLASMTNGYHFYYQEKKWICHRTKKNFWQIFQNAFAIQSNTNLNIIKNKTINIK